ncbi:MAG: hypothetical protein PHF24_04590, partial [Syntrophomonas sp.]|nr:hypothetical protein [Syntrophomonas sp.]
DPVATSLKSPRKRVAGEEITQLILAIKQRILALPHESLAIMELLRTWQQEDRLLGDVESPRLIFQHYLDLFHWIPGTALINEQLLKQLGPWIGENLRSEGQQIVAAMQEYPNILAHNNLKANISGSGSTYLHKQLLLGQFMGVS